MEIVMWMFDISLAEFEFVVTSSDSFSKQLSILI